MSVDYGFARMGIGREIEEPGYWRDDGGAKRVPVLDMNVDPPRVNRSVGWRFCLCCKGRFLSPDLRKVHMCDACRELD